MEQLEADIGRIETQLEAWGAKLDEIVAIAQEAGTDAMIDFRRRVADLRTKHRAAHSRLDELRIARREEWETAKAGVESACNDLDVAFKRLTN